MPQIGAKEEGAALSAATDRMSPKVGHLAGPFRKEKGYEVYDQD